MNGQRALKKRKKKKGECILGIIWRSCVSETEYSNVLLWKLLLTEVEKGRRGGEGGEALTVR